MSSDVVSGDNLAEADMICALRHVQLSLGTSTIDRRSPSTNAKEGPTRTRLPATACQPDRRARDGPGTSSLEQDYLASAEVLLRTL